MKYKVGDRVKMRSLQWCKENIFNNEDKYPPEFFRGIEKFCGQILTISDAVDKSKHVDEGYYNMVEDTKWEYYWTDEMIECKVEEETKYGTSSYAVAPKSNANCITRERVDELATKIDKELPSGNQYVWELPDGYQFVDENGNVINATTIALEKKEKSYPNTYKECCRIMDIDTGFLLTSYDIDFWKGHLLTSLQKLIICRDAYWKLYGEEMGLGKPWGPDDGTSIYNIYRLKNTIRTGGSSWSGNCNILEFPT